MRSVILFHYCKCGNCDSTVISIPQFDLLCLDSNFKFVGIEDDSIMLKEVERSDSCPKCRNEKRIGDVKVSKLKEELIKFVNSRKIRVRVNEWWVLNEFVDHVVDK